MNLDQPEPVLQLGNPQLQLLQFRAGHQPELAEDSGEAAPGSAGPVLPAT